MQLALFDLDHTLIPADSDHAWGQFLVRQGEVDAEQFAAANDRFYQQYCDGTLDIQAYLRFALAPLARIDPSRLHALQIAFMQECIEPIIKPQALELLRRHQARGDVCVLITATNEFVTAPIARRLGIAHLIACEVEQIEHRYTGMPKGIASFREGKVIRLLQWIEAELQDRETRPNDAQSLACEVQTQLSREHPAPKPAQRLLSRATFYSDSFNDLPLLERVGFPVATNPDDRLRAYARSRAWPCLELFAADVHEVQFDPAQPGSQGAGS